jgi:hypothetical protein
MLQHVHDFWAIAQQQASGSGSTILDFSHHVTIYMPCFIKNESSVHFKWIHLDTGHVSDLCSTEVQLTRNAICI